MSKFERIYQIDPSREIPIERERGRIEMSDQEYLSISKKKWKAIQEASHLGDRMIKEAKEASQWKIDEKNKSKSAKKKVKKVHSKSNKPAVARLQKEL